MCNHNFGTEKSPSEQCKRKDCYAENPVITKWRALLAEKLEAGESISPEEWGHPFLAARHNKIGLDVKKFEKTGRF